MSIYEHVQPSRSKSRIHLLNVIVNKIPNGFSSPAFSTIENFASARDNENEKVKIGAVNALSNQVAAEMNYIEDFNDSV